MRGVAQLELSLRPLDDGDYAVEVRFLAADSRTEAHLIDGPPVRVALDVQRLLAQSMDPTAYGHCLTEMVFADPRLVMALNTARAHADATDVPLHISLRLDPNHSLVHGIRWETLQDPEHGNPLVASERVLLSRYIDSASTQPVTARARGTMTALIVVAAPQDLTTFHLAPIDVAAEVVRAHEALGQIRTTILSSSDQPVTMAALRFALSEMPDILYLVCHGTSPMGQTVLWLEREDRTSARVDGEVLVRQIANLSRCPLLVVLASCQSAGISHDAGTLSTIAPQLARAGIAAVIAMQGNISQATIATMMPIFFRELLRDGQIDRALAAARSAVLNCPDWWMPIMLLRVRDGRLWLADTASSGDSPTLTVARHSRQRVLQHVRDHWIRSVLEHSLHGAALIALGLESRPDYAAYPWDMVVEQAGRTARSLPPGTALDAVFDEMGAELLILGTPGSGKTTMLLDLARVLLARAERDDQSRLPVVLHLSLWTERRPPLREWIASELEERYGVPPSVGATWIAENRIIPLLDGLDEVKLEHRNACVVAINDFWKAYGAGMVVCSRIADYEALSERLRLRGAILLQPLNDAQIDTYLQRAGSQLVGLREVISTDSALRDLAASPLMLSMMALAYQNKHAGEILVTTDQQTRRSHLFKSYVQRMLIRPRAGNTLQPETAISQLSWLARGMVQQSLSVFYLDEFQPTWLTFTSGRWGYAIGSSLLITLCGVFSGYLLGSATVACAILLASAAGFGPFSVLDAARTGGGLGALAGGLAAGLHLGVIIPGAQLRGVFGKIYTIRRAYWTWKDLRLSLRWKHIRQSFWLTTELRDGIVLGMSVGTVCGLFLGSLMRAQFVRSGSPIDLIAFAAPLTAFLQHPSAVMLGSLGIAGTMILIGGAVLSTRRWLVARFAKGNAVAGVLSRLFVPIQSTLIAAGPSFTLTLYIALMMRVSRQYIESVLIGGLTGIGGLCVILFFSGFVACARYETASPRTPGTVSTLPRLVDSTSIIVILTLIAAISGGLLAALMAWAFIRLSIVSGSQAQSVASTNIRDWQAWVGSGMLLAATIVSVFGLLSYGLKSTLQRFWLRIMLALTGGLDLTAPRLLEIAADRILLRKVGTGYIFIHRLVLEYFAELKPTQTTALLGSLNWALIDRGITLRELGQLEEAVTTFTQILEGEPGNYQALAERAMTYRQIGRHDACLADLDQALNLAYNQYWALAQRGITLRMLKRYDESLEDFTRAIRIKPKFGWVLAERSLTYHALARYEEALTDATRAIEFSPNFVFCRVCRARIYRELNRLTEALDDMNIAIEKQPTNDWLFYHRGMILRNLKRFDAALIDLQRAAEINPNNLQIRSELMLTRRMLQHYDEALEQSNHIISQLPATPKSSMSDWNYYQRGLIYYLIGEHVLAQADFAQAIEFAQAERIKSPTNNQNLLNLAMYLIAQGQGGQSVPFVQEAVDQKVLPAEIKEALDDLAELLSIFPDHVEAQAIQDVLRAEYTKKTRA